MRLLVTGSAGLLGALHIAVLARRVADGTLLEPVVIAQWLVAIGLIATAVWLRRRGVSVFRGKPAAAFWIVIALMHGMVALPGAPGFVGGYDAIPVTNAVPVGASLLVGVLALIAAWRSAGGGPGLARSEPLAATAAPSARTGAPTSVAARAPPV